ncbi:hypothetical protein Syun_014404 [Stephania yunnanensis]|uniref:Uncharacterized protein n=1 Tax=Stephania yunnanensis TaxID=152371 RepID=A0AAP0JJI4_9MAGN
MQIFLYFKRRIYSSNSESFDNKRSGHPHAKWKSSCKKQANFTDCNKSQYII